MAEEKRPLPIATLAARVLAGKHDPSAEEIKSLAAEALSQDQSRRQRRPRRRRERS